MTEELNISEILKGKSKGTKLYSPIFGDCTFNFIQGVTDAICVIANDTREFFDYKGLYSPTGECLLFPSRLMRDWLKFTWKKGDVLQHSEYPLTVIFESFEDDTYTSFKCKYCFNFESASKWLVSNRQCSTKHFYKVSEEEAKEFVKKVGLNYNGKLNMETLEIEKTQPEFKDEDILVTDVIPSMCYSKCIFILKGDLNTDESCANSYVFYNISNVYIGFNVLDRTIRGHNMRFATEEEKQQLFDALAKEGRAWDAEKKEVVDLKPKVELRPFDKVLVRDSKSDSWRANLFSYIDEDGDYRCVYATWVYCIPYEGNEHLLGTTKDVEG